MDHGWQGQEQGRREEHPHGIASWAPQKALSPFESCVQVEAMEEPRCDQNHQPKTDRAYLSLPQLTSAYLRLPSQIPAKGEKLNELLGL